MHWSYREGAWEPQAFYLIPTDSNISRQEHSTEWKKSQVNPPHLVHQLSPPVALATTSQRPLSAQPSCPNFPPTCRWNIGGGWRAPSLGRGGQRGRNLQKVRPSWDSKGNCLPASSQHKSAVCAPWLERSRGRDPVTWCHPAQPRTNPSQLSLAHGDPSSPVSTLSLQRWILLPLGGCGYYPHSWYQSPKSCLKANYHHSWNTQQPMKFLASQCQLPNPTFLKSAFGSI